MPNAVYRSKRLRQLCVSVSVLLAMQLLFLSLAMSQNVSNHPSIKKTGDGAEEKTNRVADTNLGDQAARQYWDKWRIWKAESVLKRADDNEDDRLSKEEATSLNHASVLFASDTNNDGQATMEELVDFFGKSDVDGYSKWGRRPKRKFEADLGSAENPNSLPAPPKLNESQLSDLPKAVEVISKRLGIFGLLQDEPSSENSRKLGGITSTWKNDPPELLLDLDVHTKAALFVTVEKKIASDWASSREIKMQEMFKWPDDLETVGKINDVIGAMPHPKIFDSIERPIGYHWKFIAYAQRLKLAIIFRNLDKLSIELNEKDRSEVTKLKRSMTYELGKYRLNPEVEAVFKARLDNKEIDQALALKKKEAEDLLNYSSRERAILKGDKNALQNGSAPTDQEIALVFIREAGDGIGKKIDHKTFEFSARVFPGIDLPVRYEIGGVSISGIEKVGNSGLTFKASYRVKGIATYVDAFGKPIKPLSKKEMSRGNRVENANRLIYGNMNLAFEAASEKLSESMEDTFELTEEGWRSSTIRRRFSVKGAAFSAIRQGMKAAYEASK